jgi:Protein of unknown function (DUF3606)
MRPNARASAVASSKERSANSVVKRTLTGARKGLFAKSPFGREIAIELAFAAPTSANFYSCGPSAKLRHDRGADSPAPLAPRYFEKPAERRSLGDVAFTATESPRGAGQSPSRPEWRNTHLVAIRSILSSREKHMNRRKPTYFRNSLDLRDKVQVKVLRKRLKLSDEQFASVVRKSGSSISAITKEVAALK